MKTYVCKYRIGIGEFVNTFDCENESELKALISQMHGELIEIQYISEIENENSLSATSTKTGICDKVSTTSTITEK